MLAPYEVITLLLVAAVHLGSVRFADRFPLTSRWLLDFSSGLGLGYAFLYLLPKIGYMTNHLTALNPDVHQLVNKQLYFYLLFGFLVYYLVDFKGSSARPSRLGRRLNLLSFSVYNLLIGATIVHLNHAKPVVYMVAATVFCLHLFGVNKFLIRMYPTYFQSHMKWSFIAMLGLGAWLGTFIEKYDPITSVATAIVGGIIIILSVRLKLPARARVNTTAFLAGVVAAAGATAIYSLMGTF